MPCPTHSRVGVNALSAAAIIALVICSMDSLAISQTYTVIHNFTGADDGAYPYAGLSIDRAGNLYGTTLAGGLVQNCRPYENGCGTVFQVKATGSGWMLIPLYRFTGAEDGQRPYGRVIIGPNGSLYGTTIGGGSDNCPGGCGVVFNLTPPPTICRTASCPWRERVLYQFAGGTDAFFPAGDLGFGSDGNLYGATTQGGSFGPGTVFKLVPSVGNWTESILYNFTGQADGGNPYAGVTLDAAGNIYTTTPAGGSTGNGAVVQVTHSGSSWIEHTLYDFQGGMDGGAPFDGVIVDPSGNLFGATSYGAAHGGGGVYEMMPSAQGWKFTSVSNFPGGPASGPWGKLLMDAAGNLYGTTQGNSNLGDYGTAFKLTRSGNGWTETILHRFTGGTDGSTPYSNLVQDGSGNLYGTTNLGGANGFGVVFKIAP